MVLALVAGALLGGKPLDAVRKGQEQDLDAMVAMSAAKRAQYAAWQPVFQKPAADADAKQRPFLQGELAKPDSLVLVHEHAGKLDGFLCLRLVNAPPVYAPGGRIGFVDDFCVKAEADWPLAGKALLLEAKAWAKAHGAVLMNVVCGPKDETKRALLKSQGLDVASEWHVGGLD